MEWSPRGAATPRLVTDATPLAAAGGEEARAGCRAKTWARSGLEGLSGVQQKEVSGDRQFRIVAVKAESAHGGRFQGECGFWRSGRGFPQARWYAVRMDAFASEVGPPNAANCA